MPPANERLLDDSRRGPSTRNKCHIVAPMENIRWVVIVKRLNYNKTFNLRRWKIYHLRRRIIFYLRKSEEHSKVVWGANELVADAETVRGPHARR